MNTTNNNPYLSHLVHAFNKTQDIIYAIEQSKAINNNTISDLHQQIDKMKNKMTELDSQLVTIVAENNAYKKNTTVLIKQWTYANESIDSLVSMIDKIENSTKNSGIPTGSYNQQIEQLQSTLSYANNTINTLYDFISQIHAAVRAPTPQPLIANILLDDQTNNINATNELSGSTEFNLSTYIGPSSIALSAVSLYLLNKYCFVITKWPMLLYKYIFRNDKLSIKQSDSADPLTGLKVVSNDHNESNNQARADINESLDQSDDILMLGNSIIHYQS